MAMRLKWQLGAVILVLLMVPTGILSYLSFFQSVQQNEFNKAEIRKTVALRAAKQIDAHLKQIQEYVHIDSNDPLFHSVLTEQNVTDDAVIFASLQNLVTKNALTVRNASLIDNVGQWVVGDSVLIGGKSETDMDYFKAQIQSDLANVYFNYSNDKEPYGLYISSPVRKAQGSTVGYLRVLIDQSIIQRLINRFSENSQSTYRIKVLTGTHLIADSHLSDQQLIHLFTDSIHTATHSLSSMPWTVSVTESNQSVQEPIANIKQYLIYQMLIIFLIAILISSLVANYLSRPVQRVRQASLNIAKGNYDLRLGPEKSKEFMDLADAINTMADQLVLSYRSLEKEHEELTATQSQITQLNEELELRVLERTEELASKNKALESAMDQIVQTEKLASLGSLVAGVSHELNTPMGIALTSSSYCLELIEEIKHDLAEKKLTQKGLQKFLGQSEEAVGLTVSNCKKASELITSFKQVSIDQTSNRRRSFNLLETMDEVERTLHGLLKNTQHQFCLEIPDDIALDSYPGAFEQVMMNLITNSIKHGFEAQTSGVINLFVEMQGEDKVSLVYQDNGRGIAAEKLAKVFDPFYTTKLGDGGSGLGLYIVYNLVTGVLGGSIELKSEPEQGVKFTLTLPICAPVQPAS